MKKYSIIFLSFVSLVLTSCFKEIDNWDSAVLDYSGRYVVRLLDAEGNAITDYDGTEIHLYSTAANKADEMWIDDFQNLLPIKTKVFFTGTPSGFKSVETDYDKLPANLYDQNAPTVKPTAEGQTYVSIDEQRDPRIMKMAVLEGKITPDGYTTRGGNVTDAIRLKVKIFYGSLTFTSYKTPESTWAVPGVPEYAWEFKESKYLPDYDKELIIEGYLYTGFDEDEF